jgi:hypothetical protein
MNLKRLHNRVKRPNAIHNRNFNKSEYDYPDGEFVIDRKRSAPGYKHLVNEKDLNCFIGLIPDWQELSKGLKAIVMDRGGYDSPMGQYSGGIIVVSAWENEISGEFYIDFLDEHKFILDLIGVDSEPRGKYCYVDFDRNSAKAFLLLHIFLHELGHHVDCMDSKSRKQPSRGEQFAEDWANEYAEILFDSYVDHFKL